MNWQWQYPQALYLLWIVPAWIALALYARSKRRRAARAFVSEVMQSRMLPREDGLRFWTKTSLWALALTFALLAMARPRFGVYFEKVQRRGSDLYILLDVSKSMLATDVTPNRIERAKADIKLLLEHLQGERVGLIAFAGKPIIKCPLTTDLGFFRLALSEVDVFSAPRGGTHIGDAIRKALEALPKRAGRDQALLLITDGEDMESYPLEAAQSAAEKHVVIFCVGLGDPNQGARIPGKTKGTYVRSDKEIHWSKLDNETLERIALKTNGDYLSASTKSYDMGKFYAKNISKLKGKEATEKKRKRLHERFQIFLAMALGCWLMNLFIGSYPPKIGNRNSVAGDDNATGREVSSR